MYYRSHFYPNTNFGNYDASNLTIDEMEEKMEGRVKNYSLKILARTGTEVITGASVQLQPDMEEALEAQMKGQSGFGWLRACLGETTQPDVKSVRLDEEALTEIIAGLNCMQAENQVAPTNAGIYYQDGAFFVQEETQGSKLNTAKLELAVFNAIYAQESELDLDEGGFYQEPELTSESQEIKDALESANACLNTKITYNVNGTQLVCDKDEISGMLTVGEDGTIAFNEEVLADFIDKVYNTYSTVGRNKKFMTTYGTEVTLTRGDYGWKVDKGSETEALKKSILAGAKETREPAYSQTAASHGTYEYGSSYVEINITAQHLFLYDKGNLVFETDFVSGNVSRGWDTRLGMSRLKYKTKDAVLRGDGYATHVNYWMPFDGGIGMHDATWRSDFGKNYYMTEGSHGCVNLPLSAAQTIYSYVSTGYPVIVYKLPGTEPVIEEPAEPVVPEIPEEPTPDEGGTGTGDENGGSGTGNN